MVIAYRLVHKLGSIERRCRGSVTNRMSIKVGLDLPIEQVVEWLLPPDQRGTSGCVEIVVVAGKALLAVGSHVNVKPAGSPDDVVAQRYVGRRVVDSNAVAGRCIDGVIADGHIVDIIDQHPLPAVVI